MYVFTETNKLIHFAVHLKLTQHCKSTILQLKLILKNQGAHKGSGDSLTSFEILTTQ